MRSYGERLESLLTAAAYEHDPAVICRRPDLPLVIGEAPNRQGQGETPWHIFATGRLAPFDIARFERTNLIKYWPGALGEGSRFPLEDGRWAARRLHATQPIGRSFILVGTRVASSFGLKRGDYEWLTWYGRAVFGIGRRVAVCPHPSGLSRWWNDPANVERASAFFKKILSPTIAKGATDEAAPQ